MSHVTEISLKATEKLFLLRAERGDCATVKRLMQEYKDKPEDLDINCVDPLNRSALITAIENGNIELIKLLLKENVEIKDALLHAIKEEYIEAVELLLESEEQHHEPGQPYSWESIDCSSSTFTPDITPLILAAHKNNYEIVKLLLDRGATLPVPHDIKCGCDKCVEISKTNSLRHSQARINAYRALISPSLIALSSRDPLLTAFELSRELRKLSRIESEFCAEYSDMRKQVQNFSTSLLDFVRTSYELEVILNYDPNDDNWDPGERQTLERLRLAINFKQKKFVAHPNVQQLLAEIWYEGVPGFRRKNILWQMIQIAKLMIIFPLYCIIYILAPASRTGQFIRKPFVKFICHSASYMFFLVFVSMASQRLEIIFLEWFSSGWIKEIVNEWKRKERGASPSLAECVVVLYVISLIWAEIKELWINGLREYLSNLWNIVDFITNMFYVTWIGLRISSFCIVWVSCLFFVIIFNGLKIQNFRQREASEGKDPWYSREHWHSFDPMLLSEGAFAAGMIFSFLKLVHIFSISARLGPLQISLGRMVIDIMKFFFIYALVLFAFACGLNQLLWYYAELEKNKCYLSNGLPDFESNEKACTIWRRYANLFETSQSLFWASFGLIDLMSFELTGIKDFTRFWALLMFGSYSVINVIVLLNMLIAMMSNSYQIISERADTEWKFARSRLWLNYFDGGDTLPPPFNIFPTPKTISHFFHCQKNIKDDQSFKRKSRNTAKVRYEAVMHQIIKRYITSEQQKRDISSVTEDDVMEIRQDISTLRYELISILRKNGMRTPQVSEEDTQVCTKKDKIMERRILGDFQIGAVNAMATSVKKSKNVFNKIAKAIRKRSRKSFMQNWNALIRRHSHNYVGPDQEGNSGKKCKPSLEKYTENNKLTDSNLSEASEATRSANMKFITKDQQKYDNQNEKLAGEEGKLIASVDSLKSSPIKNKMERQDEESLSSVTITGHHVTEEIHKSKIISPSVSSSFISSTNTDCNISTGTLKIHNTSKYEWI